MEDDSKMMENINAEPLKARENHSSHSHDHDHEHNHGGPGVSAWTSHWDLLLALGIVFVQLLLEFGFDYKANLIVSLIVNLFAYFLAGRGILKLAFQKIFRGDFFNEFVLMSIATLGAFYIGEFTEGVAVMVFYQIGEWFQDSAVLNAKKNIKALLDIRPEQASVFQDGNIEIRNSMAVEIGEVIRIKAGEKVALDGDLITENASFNTAALTGESVPVTKYQGERILAGMINMTSVADIRVSSLFKDSKLSKILEMVQDATGRKSRTQLFISRFARVYTPIVFFLALAVVVLPYFFVAYYNFDDWLYRGLVFLVISCPCALVVSIPLGYFGGIGLASRNGILFKGGNFLDVMAKVDTIVMDKTGTLTKGVFKVQEVSNQGIPKDELLGIALALERNSTHPVARSIIEHSTGNSKDYQAEKVEEIAGLGMRGYIDDKEILVGNTQLLDKYKVNYPGEIAHISETLIAISVNNIYAGHILIADEIKEDAHKALDEMRRLNLRTILLSGDKQAVVNAVAKQLGMEHAFGDLLPENKVQRLQELKDQGYRIAFAGDGINDAPVVALADAGIAMGALGSDATIETADIVIQNDQPSKIVSAIQAGKITRNVVWQNIILALTVKVGVLILGAGGMANLWEAVIADVGVALLAILNAVRIQRMTL